MVHMEHGKSLRSLHGIALVAWTLLLRPYHDNIILSLSSKKQELHVSCKGRSGSEAGQIYHNIATTHFCHDHHGNKRNVRSSSKLILANIFITILQLKFPLNCSFTAFTFNLSLLYFYLFIYFIHSIMHIFNNLFIFCFVLYCFLFSFVVSSPCSSQWLMAGFPL